MCFGLIYFWQPFHKSKDTLEFLQRKLWRWNQWSINCVSGFRYYWMTKNLQTWKLSSINFFDSGSKKPKPGTGTSDMFTVKLFSSGPNNAVKSFTSVLCFVGGVYSDSSNNLKVTHSLSPFEGIAPASNLNKLSATALLTMETRWRTQTEGTRTRQHRTHRDT